MQVILAESAGFCYGVKRAVELAQKTAEEPQGCWMLGDLIHNTHVVNDLAARGVRKTDRPEALGAGDTVVIRSHGELKSVLDGLAARGVRCVNATCPNVVHIQELVSQAERRDGRWSSSESRTIRRSWDLPAGAFIRWCSRGRKLWRNGSKTAIFSRKCP